jgi:hypothetical protein
VKVKTAFEPKNKYSFEHVQIWQMAGFEIKRSI